MKKIKTLLVILLITMIAFPFNVNAEEKKPEKGKDPVNVYIFRSDTCGYCKAALEWFTSIEEEYGDYFNLVEYEVSSTENSNLWSEVATFMGDTPSGVPYIVVGKDSYPNGFASDTVIDNESGKTMGDEMIEKILKIYESDNRYDVMVEINNKPDYSNIVGIASVVIIAGLIAVAVISRKQNS